MISAILEHKSGCGTEIYPADAKKTRNLRGEGSKTLYVRPRAIYPGSRYLITRRCTQRQFWLRPCALTNQIILYCLAYASTECNIQISAICALSNHYHAVVTDPDGRLPEFLASAHKLIAKCLNTHYKRWENLWSSDGPSVVRLEDDAAVLEKIAYTLANPVSEFLVRRGTKWPGIRTTPADVVGAQYEVARPPVFFRKDGPMPETITLRLERPDVCSELSDAELADRVQELVTRHEADARAERAREGRGFTGVKGVLKQQPYETPDTDAPRQSLSPRIAAGDAEVRVNALRRMKAFEKGHREALLAWRSGDRNVVFPAGTYAMRVNHAVRCASGLPP